MFFISQVASVTQPDLKPTWKPSRKLPLRYSVGFIRVPLGRCLIFLPCVHVAVYVSSREHGGGCTPSLAAASQTQPLGFWCSPCSGRDHGIRSAQPCPPALAPQRRDNPASYLAGAW